jgi:nucleoside-diphosphate-sugar epimerase
VKVLFIGGTGLISLASTRLAVELGIDLYLFNRGSSGVGQPKGVVSLQGDIRDPVSTMNALRGHEFDAVVNWIAFSPADIERDIALFGARIKQYIFISSASAYQKPHTRLPIREDTPLVNPFWQYSRDKTACEEAVLKAVRERGFPGVIVRPSLTYGDSMIPLIVNSWDRSYTVVGRMKRGQKVIVPGDGTSLWTLTHNTDFAKGLVGLLGREQTIGQAFHITSDEMLTWNQIYEITASVAETEARIIHIPSDFIVACCPDEAGSLLGDKSASAIFDNSKIKQFVPSFQATTSFACGIKQTLAWFEADEARREIDIRLEERWDKMIAAYETGLAAGRKSFST